MALFTALAIAGTAATVAGAASQASAGGGGKKGGLTGTQKDLQRANLEQFEHFELTRNPLMAALFGAQATPQNQEVPAALAAFPQSDLGQFLKGGYAAPTAQSVRAALRSGQPLDLNPGPSVLPEPLRLPYQLYNEDLALQGRAAREDIRRTIGARGGQLTDLLAENRLAEAMARAKIPLQEGPIRTGLFNTLLGASLDTGSSSPAAGLQAVTQAQVAAQQQQAQGKDTLGTIGGLALSLGKGGLGGAGGAGGVPAGFGTTGTTLTGLPWLGTGSAGGI
jgi:hypothetical protein